MGVCVFNFLKLFKTNILIVKYLIKFHFEIIISQEVPRTGQRGSLSFALGDTFQNYCWCHGEEMDVTCG